MDQPEATRLVQVPRCVQAFKGPEVGLSVIPGVRERQRLGEQTAADPMTSELVRGDEPAQVSPGLMRAGTIEDDRAFDLRGACEPDPISFRNVGKAELAQLTRHLGLERDAETVSGGVVGGMKLRNPANATGFVAFRDDGRHEWVNCEAYRFE